jgi:hypothetical protein
LRTAKKNGANSDRALWGHSDYRHAYFTTQVDRREDRARELLADTKAIGTSDH